MRVLLGIVVALASICVHTGSYMTSSQDLLAFLISGEKSAVILIGLPLYVTRHFSLTAFNILSLFSIFRVLIIL